MTVKFTLSLILFSAFISLTYAETSKLGPNTQIQQVLILGDSLSAAHHLPQSKGWVALFQKRLDDQGYKIDVENASVSGLTTAAALQKIDPLMTRLTPGLVIIELGANDGLQGKPLSYIKLNLEKLIEKAQQGNAKVLLLGNHLPPNLGKRYTQPFFDQFGVLANKHQTGLIAFMLKGVATHQELMLKDGLHPNEGGQKQVFKYLWPGLEQAINETKLVRY